LLKSADRGRTWTTISGDLPEKHLVWSVVQDHINPELLFVGTEFGVFFTPDGGQHWIKLKGGLPTISFRDLEIQRREDDLVAASFGRGIYILDDYSVLRDVNENVLKEEAHLFPVKKALLYVPASPLGGGEKASQGAAYFNAPNPPFGAVFTYHLSEALRTEREKRREREKELRKAKGDIPFPGWESLRRESRENKPQVALTVSGEGGEVIRRITAPSGDGFHRVAWDLRYPSVEPVVLREGSSQAGTGPLVLPGRFRVTLSKLLDGVETPLSTVQTFEVVALGGSTLPAQDPNEVLRFQQQTGELLRRALSAQRIVGETSRRIQYIRKALILTPSVSSELFERTRDLELELADLKEILEGDSVRNSFSEPIIPGVISRLRKIVNGHWRNTYGPTQTHRRNFEIAERSFTTLRNRLKELVERKLVRLEKDLETAKAPYTPGRAVH
jgi:hypothetical protein